MIDEFQDTDEIQFKIILLVCKNINGSVNLCSRGLEAGNLFIQKYTDRKHYRI